MAKPRVFISSTYYDLKHIRKSIELFIHEVGYESVLFENGDIPFDHEVPLDESCYKELESCQIFVLIIGGRYGSPASNSVGPPSMHDLSRHYEHFNSVTKKEYEAAKQRDIPIFIFIEKGVAAEYLTYKENKANEEIKFAHVDSVNIFRLIDSLYAETRNNLVREFENVEDITAWLKDQWAGLFNQFLMNKSSQKQLSTLEQQLKDLSSVVKSLEDYSELMIKSISPDTSENAIETVKSKKAERDIYNRFADSDFAYIFKSISDFGIEEGFEALKNSSNLAEFYLTIVKKSNSEDFLFLLDHSFYDHEMESIYRDLRKLEK